MAEVELKINGQFWGGWERVQITRSMEHISGTFNLMLADRGPDTETRRAFAPFSGCEVWVDGEVVITGYVDDPEIEYDESQHGIMLSGRDATGDLVDCSAVGQPGEWSNVGLSTIITDLCRPFGIPVAAALDTGAVFLKFKIEEGDTVFETIDRACRQRRVLANSDGLGGVVLTRAGSKRAGTALIYGQNIKRGSGKFSSKDRFSHYTLKGQQPSMGDLNDAESSAAVTAQATDPGVPRYRPLVIIADHAGNAAAGQQRVNWEASVRAARSRRVTYTVQGWRETQNGALWSPNTIVPVQDPLLGIAGDMLIVAVTFIKDIRGSRSALSLALPGSFDLSPAEVAKASGSKGELEWLI